MITRLVFVGVVSAVSAMAQSAAQKLVDSSVLVWGAIEKDGKLEGVSRPGGFIIDATHLVTDLPGCCGKTKEGAQMIPFVAIGSDTVRAKVVWSNQAADLAILEVPSPLKGPAVSVAPV